VDNGWYTVNSSQANDVANYDRHQSSWPAPLSHQRHVALCTASSGARLDPWPFANSPCHAVPAPKRSITREPIQGNRSMHVKGWAAPAGFFPGSRCQVQIGRGSGMRSPAASALQGATQVITEGPVAASYRSERKVHTISGSSARRKRHPGKAGKGPMTMRGRRQKVPHNPGPRGCIGPRRGTSFKPWNISSLLSRRPVMAHTTGHGRRLVIFGALWLS